MSPHLQVYKPQLTSVLSIIHRGTGVGLAVGTLFITWWLVAAASGPGPYEATREFYGSWFGQLVLFGFSVCLFYHLCNGVRHLFWDAGWMLEIEDVYRSGWVMLCASVVLTFIAWFIGLSL
jgi:succinate dehydrogenase / fumarate reductase cytochrome b subunit